LNLSAGSAYDQLVGVLPDVKLEGPPPDQGSRMPLTGAPLTEAEIQRIRDWIA
jgi:hypothetical protein